jgi:acetylxylan esterase
VGVYGTGVTHNIPVNGDLDMEWFGITGGGSPQPTPTSTVTPGPTTTASSTTSSVAAPDPSGCTSPRWAQCNGNGYSGCKTCVSPHKCTFVNDWYSQCL